MEIYRAMLTVSLCVVALNEEKHIINLLTDLKNQTYPHNKTEIILIDSGSSDKTKLYMQEFEHNNNDYFSIKVLDNEKRIQAAGWNIAIKESTCDVIIRIDGHSMIPPNFVELNIINLESGEYISGGIRPCIIENSTKWGEILLQTENSLFGSSFNKSRHSAKKQYVKTMFHAAYRRVVFEKAGLFNEKLLRTEDNELHYRIRKAGYKFCYDPNIQSYQYARSSFKKMIKQKYLNGYWIGLTLGICPGCLSIYHFIPFIFLLVMILSIALCFFQFYLLLIILFALYGIFAVLNSIISCIGKKFNYFVFIMPFLFLILHISYGVGTLIGLLKMPFVRKKILT